jgi:DNA-binding transcriptional ArsR family regulator
MPQADQPDRRGDEGREQPERGVDEGGGAERPSAAQSPPQSPLAEALASRRKELILLELNDRGPMSASALARALGLPQSTVNEHVKWLREKGLLEETEVVQKRNAVERLLHTTEASYLLEGAAWEALPSKRKLLLISNSFASLQEWFAAAMQANKGDFPADSMWSVTIHTLDAKGRAELTGLHEKMAVEVGRITKASRARLERSGQPGVRTCQTQMLFDVPSSEGGPADRDE